MSKINLQAMAAAFANSVLDRGYTLAQLKSAMAGLTEEVPESTSAVSVQISARPQAIPPHLAPKPAAQAELDRAIREGLVRRFTPGVSGIAELEVEAKAKAKAPAKLPAPAGLTLEDLGL